MKKTNMNISLDELRENLASANAEVAKISEQLKAVRKTRKAYERLEAALKEQRKAARKVERALQRVIDAKEAEELLERESSPVEVPTAETVPAVFNFPEVEDLSDEELEDVSDEELAAIVKDIDSSTKFFKQLETEKASNENDQKAPVENSEKASNESAQKVLVENPEKALRKPIPAAFLPQKKNNGLRTFLNHKR